MGSCVGNVCYHSLLYVFLWENTSQSQQTQAGGGVQINQQGMLQGGPSKH